jgi:Flp pilus assembly CpaE family ATPase
LPILSAEQCAALVGALSRRFRYVVVDLGRGVPANSQPVLRQADHIIACIRPERVAISAGRQMVRQLRAILPRVDALHVVMLDFGEGRQLPRPAVEEYLQHALLAVLPFSPGEIAEAVNKTLPVVRLRPEGQTALHFHHLARQLGAVKREA